MKFVILLALLGLALARPQEYDDITVVRNELTGPDENYNFQHELELSDNTRKNKYGEFQERQTEFSDTGFLIMRGSYSWFDPDGKEHKIEWIADEKGYRASGDSIPVFGQK